MSKVKNEILFAFNNSPSIFNATHIYFETSLPNRIHSGRENSGNKIANTLFYVKKLNFGINTALTYNFFVILFKTILKTNFICKILFAALPNIRVLVLIIQGKQKTLKESLQKMRPD